MTTDSMPITPPTMRRRAQFKGQVLRKIYRVWLLRRFAPIVIVEIATISLLVYQIGRVVFIRRVVENGTEVLFSRPGGMVSFVVDMFVHANPGTRFLGLSIILFAALIIRHLTQGLLRWILVKENFFQKR